MPQPSRLRVLRDPCPKCDVPLRVEERGITVTGTPEPVAWAAIRLVCRDDCELTACDLPQEVAELAPAAVARDEAGPVRKQQRQRPLGSVIHRLKLTIVKRS